MNDAVILSACRTQIGSFGGLFKDLYAAELGAVVIREHIKRADIKKFGFVGNEAYANW